MERMTPEERRIKALEEQLRTAKERDARIKESKKRLDRAAKALDSDYRVYRKAWKNLLDEWEWTPETATKRGIVRPETLMRRMINDQTTAEVKPTEPEEATTVPQPAVPYPNQG